MNVCSIGHTRNIVSRVKPDGTNLTLKLSDDSDGNYVLVIDLNDSTTEVKYNCPNDPALLVNEKPLEYNPESFEPKGVTITGKKPLDY